MQQVSLSVCIPVYNCEAYIGQAIRSVLDQDYRDLELVIVDNRSTDRTVEVVKSFTDERIRLVENDSNIGMVANWNKAVSLARGKFVKVLPADDYLYPGCLRRQCAALENDREGRIALVSGRKAIVDGKGKTLFTRGYSRRDVESSGPEAINKVVRSGGNILGEPGVVMFRKSAFDKAGPFTAEIYYVMDLNMWLRMLLFGNLFSIGDVVCAFRISPVSESIRQIKTQRRDIDAYFKSVFVDKRFRLTRWSYCVGLFNSLLSAQAKKVIYKLVIR